MSTGKIKIILASFVVVGIILFIFLAGKKEVVAPSAVPTTPPPAVLAPSVIGDKEDLVSFSVSAGAALSGKITVTGSVKGGYFFEANIIVNVLDVHKKIIKSGYGTATDAWMTAGPVAFTSDLDLTGLAKGPAYLSVENDNPSGLEEYRKQILIPITIQ